MNAARGFWRVTLVVSVGVLIVGLVFVGTLWQSAAAKWRAAERVESPRPIVYIADVGIATFPTTFREEQIRGMLESSSASITTLRARVLALRAYRAQFPEYGDLTDEKLAAALLKKDPQAWSVLARSPTALPVDWELQTFPTIRDGRRSGVDAAFLSVAGGLVTHAYLPGLASGGPWMLYTRRAALRAEASGILSDEGRQALTELRRHTEFPPSPADSDSPLEWWPFLAAVFGAAVAPWGLFYILRWVGRGFAAQ